MTEDKRYFGGELAEVGVELEGLLDVPSLNIENLKIKNLNITVYCPGALGGGDDE